MKQYVHYILLNETGGIISGFSSGDNGVSKYMMEKAIPLRITDQKEFYLFEPEQDTPYITPDGIPLYQYTDAGFIVKRDTSDVLHDIATLRQ